MSDLQRLDRRVWLLVGGALLLSLAITAWDHWGRWHTPRLEVRNFVMLWLYWAPRLAGLPLLAGGRGGLGVFASPTVGFLVGFPVAALVTGWIVETWRSAPVGIAAGIAAVLGGVVVLYAFGVAGNGPGQDKGGNQNQQ